MKIFEEWNTQIKYNSPLYNFLIQCYIIKKKNNRSKLLRILLANHIHIVNKMSNKSLLILNKFYLILFLNC